MGFDVIDAEEKVETVMCCAKFVVHLLSADNPDDDGYEIRVNLDANDDGGYDMQFFDRHGTAQIKKTLVSKEILDAFELLITAVVGHIDPAQAAPGTN